MSNRDKFFKNYSDDPYHLIQIEVFREVFQEHKFQSRMTFYTFMVGIGFSLAISGAGALMLLSGKAAEGTVTTAAGLLSTSFCGQVAKESSDRLNRLAEDLRALRPDKADKSD